MELHVKVELKLPEVSSKQLFKLFLLKLA